MAPSPITEDYYAILEVEQTTGPELITKSYKRLALKLHPDRNTKHDATEAFQLLGRAYETLKDENTRRAYDLIYPSIIRRRTSSQNSQTLRSPAASASQSEALSEATQIAALRKSKQERAARWRTKKTALDASIFELQRAIRRLEQEIKNLDSILAAEAAAEAQKNSWATWLLSPIYKKAEDSEEEKARKDRQRQERRIEKDMKERRLYVKAADLKTQETLLRTAKEEVDAADLSDDGKIQVIQTRTWLRENRQRQEREKAERERRAKELRQQQEQRENRDREAAEALRKQQAEARAAEQRRYEERERQRIIEEARRHQEQARHFDFTERSSRQTCTSTCRHDGWWTKVQGRTACPKCQGSWTYLLQCPGCEMKACPRCQAAIRPRLNQRTPPRPGPRVRIPSPGFGYNDSC
ncbi:hypothetical protein F5883DRAFT_590396, partial [Diaporthe sp. PMI_573]